MEGESMIIVGMLCVRIDVCRALVIGVLHNNALSRHKKSAMHDRSRA